MSASRLAALVLVTGGATAAADPRVDLDRCDGLDRTALRHAVDAELAGLAAEKLAAVNDHVIVVECPDAVTANLRLDPPPSSGPIARSLDLGEVPGELRARLVALAVVEVVEVTAMVLGAASEPTTTSIAPTTGHPPDRASGIDPTPLGDRTPHPATGGPHPAPVRPDPAAGFAPPSLVDRPSGPPVALSTRRAIGDRGGLFHGRAIAPRVGLRIYPSRAVPMLDVAVELLQGAIALGITGAVGQTDDPLGTVRPYLLAGTAGITVACARRGAFEACTSARLTAGLAGASSSATAPMIASTSATAPYLELGGELELAWRGRHRAGLLAIDAGWAEGLIATAGPREAARLAGTVIVTTIGARW